MTNEYKSKELLEESIRIHKEKIKEYEEELKQLNKYYHSSILYNYIEFDEISEIGLEVLELINDLQEDIENKNNISEDMDCLIESLIKWKEELIIKFQNKLEGDEELAYLLMKQIILKNKKLLLRRNIKMNKENFEVTFNGDKGYNVKCNQCGNEEYKESISFQHKNVIHKVEDYTTVKLFVDHCYDSDKNSKYANPFIGQIRYTNTLKQFRGVLKGILNNMVEEFDYPNWECIVMIGEGIAWKYVYAVGDLKTEDYLEDVSEKDKNKFIEWYKKEYNNNDFTGKIEDMQKYLFSEDKCKEIFDKKYNKGDK